jgi:addiction module HigA family antidote
MAKITVHPGGFIKRNYIDELGLTATELADALEVSESTLSRLVHEKIDLSPALAVKMSKVLGRSAESWMAMQANHTLARYQAELEQWTPTKQVTAEGLRRPSEQRTRLPPPQAVTHGNGLQSRDTISL